MGIVSWLQEKFGGRQEKKRLDMGSSSTIDASLPEFHKEFCDSLRSLLAIGTLGSNELNEGVQRSDSSKNICSSQNLIDFTAEEVIKLQKELSKLLASKTKHDGSDMAQNGTFLLNRFLNRPSGLKVEFCDDSNQGDTSDLSPNKKIILNRAIDLLSDNCNMIKQKSVSFPLKKMFICRSGLALTNLKEPVPESRMEKLFKAILRKKVYPRNPAPTQPKKYLEKNLKEKTWFEDEMHKERDNGGQWVTTDSEYIVLEMTTTDEV